MNNEPVWVIKFDYDTGTYFIFNTETYRMIKIPHLTDLEIKRNRYQRYFDKAYVAKEIANGKTVYLSRYVTDKNGKEKEIVYRYTPKGIKQ